ncbi:MAG TPA: hypothetical protein VMU78_10735 [Methylocella sp.]|nr:hypothetical protein [Methylocella sp.]
MKWNLLCYFQTRLWGAGVIALICLASGPFAQAQQAKTGGSPLDTIMSTRLWADVPEAKDFVRDARPPLDSLSYQPVTGTDPERPKPRSTAELQALQSELERAAVHNERTAEKRLGFKKPASAATKSVKGN